MQKRWIFIEALGVMPWFLEKIFHFWLKVDWNCWGFPFVFDDKSWIVGCLCRGWTSEKMKKVDFHEILQIVLDREIEIAYTGEVLTNLKHFLWNSLETDISQFLDFPQVNEQKYVSFLGVHMEVERVRMTTQKRYIFLLVHLGKI
jgi:hypothetical protein